MGVSLYGDQVAIYGFYCFVIGFVACSVALMVLQVHTTDLVIFTHPTMCWARCSLHSVHLHVSHAS